MNERIRIKPGRTVGLKMTGEERSLVLQESLALDEDLEAKLSRTAGDQVGLTLDELDLLAGEVAAIVGHAKDRKLRKKLDRICDRIERLLEMFEKE